MKKHGAGLIAGCLAAGACTALLAAAGAAPARVEAIRVAEYDARTRLVIELDRNRSHSLMVLDDQPRVVVDISSSTLHASLPQRGRGIVRDMRHASHDGGTLRMVFDLRAPATVRSAVIAAENPNGRHRIVVDVFHGSAESLAPAAANGAPAARDVLIAIDPGHGGKDPGAIGRNGSYEKTVVLGISRRLARLVEREPGMRAMLTRNGDYYLKLRSRYEMARRRNADLFVSVHADAVRDRRVQGSSVYVLSEKGSSDEARRLAKRENASDLMAGVELDEYPPAVATVIIDLQQNASIGASLEVADEVLQHLQGVGRVRKVKVQKAPFAVLKAHDVPSILVETAYISNPREEQLLKTAGYQEKLARALLAGVRSYFYRNPPRGTLIADRVAAGEVPQQQYVARRGDTLSGIAQRFKVPVPVLMRANKLPNDRLRVGQVLTIPAT